MNRAITKSLKQHIVTSTIFPHLVHTAAFVDTVVLNVDGELSNNYGQQLSSITNVGTMRPGSLYSRRVFASWPLTGNPITINYGRLKQFVPRLRLTLRSEKTPLSGAQIQLLLSRLTGNSADVTVSSLELTFDVSGVELNWVREHLLHRAHRTLPLRDENGRRTFYVGSTKSSWEVRIYEKTSDVLRLEFILRRQFLKKHNINQPEDILLLRRIKIWRLLSIRWFSRSNAIKISTNWENDTARKIFINWDRGNRTRSGLLRMLRLNRIDPKLVLRKTRLQRQLERMQQQLFW